MFVVHALFKEPILHIPKQEVYMVHLHMCNCGTTLAWFWFGMVRLCSCESALEVPHCVFSSLLKDSLQMQHTPFSGCLAVISRGTWLIKQEKKNRHTSSFCDYLCIYFFKMFFFASTSRICTCSLVLYLQMQISPCIYSSVGVIYTYTVTLHNFTLNRCHKSELLYSILFWSIMKV